MYNDCNDSLLAKESEMKNSSCFLLFFILYTGKTDINRKDEAVFYLKSIM